MRTARKLMTVLSSGNLRYVVQNGLVSWLQVDAQTGFYTPAVGAYTPTNQGLTYSGGWIVGNGTDQYMTLPKPTEITNEITMVMYVNPTLSNAHEAKLDKYHQFFSGNDSNFECLFRTYTSEPGAGYYLRQVVSYTGAILQAKNYAPAAKFTAPFLIHAIYTPTYFDMYVGATSRNLLTYTGSGNLNLVPNFYFWRRVGAEQYSEMGLRDILIYNRALTAAEVAQNVAQLHL